MSGMTICSERMAHEALVEAVLAAAREFKKHPSTGNLNELTRLWDLALSPSAHQATELQETKFDVTTAAKRFPRR